VIKQPSSLYNDLLMHPLLFNYYVAYKEATLLRGSLHVDFEGEVQQMIRMEIPVGPQFTEN